MDQKLIDYIKKELNKGFTNEQIRTGLIKAGHEAAKVDEHIKQVAGSQHKSNNKLAALVVILIIAFSVGFYYLTNPSDKVQQHMDNGWISYKNGNFDEAIAGFEKVIEKEPDNYIAYNGLGNSYYKLKNYEKAEEYFNKSLELNPQNDDAFNGLGWIYLKRGNANLDKNAADSSTYYSYSKQNFEKALDVNEHYAYSFNGLGWIYLKMGNANLDKNPADSSTYYSYSKQNFEKALDLDEHYANALIGLGLVHYYFAVHLPKENPTEQLKIAQENIENAALLEPANKDLFAERYLIYFEQQNFEKAFGIMKDARVVFSDEQFNKILDKIHTEMEFKVTQPCKLLTDFNSIDDISKNYNVSATLFEELTRISSENSFQLYKHYCLQEYATVFQIVESSDKGFAEYTNLEQKIIVNSYKEINQSELLLKFYENYEKSFIDEINYAFLLYQNKSYEKAKTKFEWLITKDPNNMYRDFMEEGLGWSYFRLGNTTEAKIYLKKSINSSGPVQICDYAHFLYLSGNQAEAKKYIDICFNYVNNGEFPFETSLFTLEELNKIRDLIYANNSSAQ